MSQSPKEESPSLGGGAIAAFCAPRLVTSVLHGQTLSALPGVYALYFGLDLGMIGATLMLVRVFDAITDPLIGYASDRTTSRFGKRKPWVLGGTIAAIPAILFFFMPHDGVGIVYFAFWYAILFTAWTAIEIPMLAWQIEISHDYATRTRIAAVRFAFGTIGNILFFLVPLLPIFTSRKLTPETLEWIAYALAILLPVTVLAAVTIAPRGQTLASSVRSESIRQVLQSVLATGPARVYFAAVSVIGLALGMSLSAFFLYVDTYMGLGDKIAYLWTIPSVVMLTCLPVWTYLCTTYNRHHMWALSTTLGSILMFGVFFIAPGPQSFYPYLMLLCLFQVASAAGEIASPGVIGDAVDYDTLKTGINKSGQFTAASLLIVKISSAIGAALGFYQLKSFGFDPNAETQDAMATLGAQLTVAGAPAILFIIAAMLIWRFPIDKRQQKIIRRRLEQRMQRQEVQPC